MLQKINPALNNNFSQKQKSKHYPNPRVNLCLITSRCQKKTAISYKERSHFPWWQHAIEKFMASYHAGQVGVSRNRTVYSLAASRRPLRLVIGPAATACDPNIRSGKLLT